MSLGGARYLHFQLFGTSDCFYQRKLDRILDVCQAFFIVFAVSNNVFLINKDQICFIINKNHKLFYDLQNSLDIYT